MGYGHDQGFYYPPDMETSHGPHVGQSGPQVNPSALARFEFDNPLTRGLSDLTTRISALELRQQEMGHNIKHNTSLTQESWGMLSSIHYDWNHGPADPYPASIPRSRLAVLSLVKAWGGRLSVPR